MGWKLGGSIAWRQEAFLFQKKSGWWDTSHISLKVRGSKDFVLAFASIHGNMPNLSSCWWQWLYRWVERGKSTPCLIYSFWDPSSLPGWACPKDGEMAGYLPCSGWEWLMGGMLMPTGSPNKEVCVLGCGHMAWKHSLDPGWSGGLLWGLGAWNGWKSVYEAGKLVSLWMNVFTTPEGKMGLSCLSEFTRERGERKLGNEKLLLFAGEPPYKCLRLYTPHFSSLGEGTSLLPGMSYYSIHKPDQHRD